MVLYRLSMNIIKTKHMIIPSNRESCQCLNVLCKVSVNGDRLENVHNCNYLGVIFYDCVLQNLWIRSIIRLI